MSYYNNGNMTEQRNHPNFGIRRLCWDEENRLTGMKDDLNAGLYFYDAGGERTVKMSGTYLYHQ